MSCRLRCRSWGDRPSQASSGVKLFKFGCSRTWHVKPRCFLKCALRICCALMNQLPQPRLDGCKESFYPPIAPGRTNRRGLLANARQFQECGEHEAVEDGLVVRAHSSWFAVPTDGQAQMSQQRPAALVDWSGEPNAQSRAVIENFCYRRWRQAAASTSGGGQTKDGKPPEVRPTLRSDSASGPSRQSCIAYSIEQMRGGVAFPLGCAIRAELRPRWQRPYGRKVSFCGEPHHQTKNAQSETVGRFSLCAPHTMTTRAQQMRVFAGG